MKNFFHFYPPFFVVMLSSRLRMSPSRSHIRYKSTHADAPIMQRETTPNSNIFLSCVWMNCYTLLGDTIIRLYALTIHYWLYICQGGLKLAIQTFISFSNYNQKQSCDYNYVKFPPYIHSTIFQFLIKYHFSFLNLTLQLL